MEMNLFCFVFFFLSLLLEIFFIFFLMEQTRCFGKDDLVFFLARRGTKGLSFIASRGA